MNKISMLFLTCVMGGCGLSQPKYVNYTPAQSSTSAECVSAQAAFDKNVEPTVASVCLGCHNVQPLGGATLIAGNAAQHRKQLKVFTSTNAATLFTKISNKSTTGHGGGDRSTDLPAASIQAWTDLEALCK